MLKITSLLTLTLASTPFLMAQTANAAPTKSAAKSASWIALKARTDKKHYVAGEPIKVTIMATNIQSKDAYLKFSSGQRFELRLFQVGANELIYTWSANKMFAQMISHVRLKQSESKIYNAEIGDEMGALQPGTYRLETNLTNSSQIAAQPIRFTVAASSTASSTASSAANERATLTATADKRVYKVGEEVKIDFALQNNSDRPAIFDFNSGQTYDVFIRNESNELIWNWGANKRFMMVMRKVTLAAGEKQNFSVKWDGRALPDSQITVGKYKIETVYSSHPQVRAAPVEIEIR